MTVEPKDLMMVQMLKGVALVELLAMESVHMCRTLSQSKL